MAADDYHMISKHGKTAASTAVSPNSIKKPKERVPAKPDMPEVNRFLMCQLCSGYLIDATAIVECQHTFCKSCILKYLDTNSYCPICDVQLNKAKPHLSLRSVRPEYSSVLRRRTTEDEVEFGNIVNIKVPPDLSDVIIQRLVYKLVPGLLVSEIRRRRDFSIKNGMDPVEAAELASNSIAEEIEAASDLSTVLSLDDVVSLSVEYFRSEGKGSPESSTKVADTNGKPSQSSTSSSSTQSSQNQQASQQQHHHHNQQPKSNVKSNTVNNSSGSTTSSTNTSTECDGNSNSSEQANDRRYLQCPAAVSVGLLKKFIRMKYGLSDDYRVDLLYNGDRDSILENDLTLLDVAFIFKWNKDEPMKFHYRIFERPSKTLTVFSGMKRPAPSVMDEPPDDDTTSGSHNRSSMFSSSSSAPSTKHPRLADNTGTSGNQGSVSKDNTSGKSTTTATSKSTASAPTTNETSSNSNSNNNNTTSASGSTNTTCSTNSSTTKAPIKVEREDVEEDDDDDEDEEEDYELVERKEHMKGIKSSRKNSIKESLKRSVASSNLRSSISSRSTHSTDTKANSVESERESRNENSLNSNSINNSKYKVGVVKKGRGRPPKSVDSLKLRVSSTPSASEHSGSEHKTQQSSGSLKLSISKSGVTPVVSSSSSNSGEKKEPLKLSLGSVLANKGSKSPERKHHKHKHHHHHHKLRHRDKQSKGVTSTATVASIHQNSQKPLKISFTLSPPSGGAGSNNQSQNVMIKESSSTEAKDQQQQQQQHKGKPLTGNQNFNNSARTSASAHGHLNNISKSISVSVNTNNSGSGSTTTTVTSSGNNNVKGNQYGNKVLSPAELIPKNTGIEIQPTTIPISSSHSQISQHSVQHSGGNNGVGGGASSHNTSNSSHKHSHPLLPDSVHVPKSVTLIPVNPNQINVAGSVSGNVGKGSAASQEKGVSGSQSNQNRINAHTFTHPITNKSLHQITVTEVPPPQKNNISGGGGGIIGTSTANIMNSSSLPVNTTSHSSISGTTSNPIEKVIANAANNKPQFNGPGSMEITKIYCGAPGIKENPAKKLKDRKGLDISITGTGINVSVNKSSQKLEEALRQKVNIAIGGGTGSISVTHAPSNNNMNMNKGKSAAATAASLLSGKMPPGITIGPATVPTSSSNNISSGNGNNNNNNGPSSTSNNMGSANAGNNIMKGLGFTLPPHLTAHPHNPNNSLNKSLSSNQGKSDNKMGTATTTQLNTQNSRLLGKDSVSIIGKGNVVQNLAGGQQQQQQQPPPVEITISAASSGSGNKSQTNITNRGISITNNNAKSKMSNDPLASILDITQGLQRKSPTMTINNTNAKGMMQQQQQQQQQNSNSIPLNSQQTTTGSSSTNKNFSGNKRPFEMSNVAQQTSKNSVKESPEAKRGRSTSSDSSSSLTTLSKKSGEGEIPLDLSGRSTRTTPPLIIPQILTREPSKSPSRPTAAAGAGGVDKLNSSKSPETVKAGTLITPPTSTSSSVGISTNFLSPKMNVNCQKSGAESLNKGQSVKSISVSKLSPNQSSKIGSIVDSLAQKQAQAQQQNMQKSQSQQQQHHQQQQQQNQKLNVKNLQNHHHHQQQQQQNVSHHKTPSNSNSSTLNKSPNSNHSNVNNSSSSVTNQTQKQSPTGTPNNNKSSSSSSSGLTSPITATPVIPMTSTSPPGGVDHMRNLWALDPTRQGKMNELSLAGLFSPPGHPHHLGAAAAHQIAVLQAAAASGSPSGGPMSAFSSNILAQFGHHLAAMGQNKLYDAQLAQMAAAFNANAHAAAAAARMHHPFVGSMSPPLTLPNAFFPPHGSPSAGSAQQQTSPIAASGSPQIQQATVSPQSAMKAPNNLVQKSGNSSGNNVSAKSNSSPFAPLFSHSVPVSSPKSPNTSNLTSGSTKPPTSGTFTSNTVSSFTSTTSSSTSSSSSSSMPSLTPSQDQKRSHSSGKSSSGSHHHHHHHESSSSSTHSSSSSGSSSSVGGGMKSTKINGTMSTAMPVFPPGIHNPLLRSNSSNTSNNSNSSGNSLQFGNSLPNSSSLNKTFTSSLHPTNNAHKSNVTTKGAIPNSMKISNFLPSKPKDSSSDANAEATITSGSNFGMSSIQAKPNFSLSPSRAHGSDSHMNNSFIPSAAAGVVAVVNNEKSPSFKEGPLSPVKQLSSNATGGTSTNKPSSLTCASLLLPDFSKPSLHPHPHHPHHHSLHPLNSLSPKKGDHGLSLSRGNRTPSTDSILLSPTKTSPGASSSTFNKTSEGNKDGFQTHGLGSKTISHTKDEIISKKEIGSIPMGPQVGVGGPTLPRNFLSPTTSSLHNTQSLSLNRPIPTIPAFLNRSSNGSTMSSTSAIVSHHHHHHHQLVPSTTSPSSHSLHVRAPSPTATGKAPKSPVKSTTSSSPTQLPSPVFPFPGVSVPVQVKLQDDEIPLASNTNITASTTTPQVSLKSEVNQLLAAAKEEKIEQKRRLSIEQNLDAKTSSSSSSPTKLISSSTSSISPPDSKKIKSEEKLSNENPLTKVPKLDTQAGSCSSVKNEKETPILDNKSSNRESNRNDDDGKSSTASKGANEKNESESTLREIKASGGEQESKKGDGAGPSKEISCTAPALLVAAPCSVEQVSASTHNIKAVLPVQVSTEKVSTEPKLPNSSPPQKPTNAPQVLDAENKILAGEQTEGKCVKENIDISIIPEKKSETQIVADMDVSKSDHDNDKSAQVNRQEWKSSEICGNEQQENICVDDNDEEEACKEIDVDVEMEEDEIEKEKQKQSGKVDDAMGQSDIVVEEEMETCVNDVDVEDNQMEIDVESNEEKMENGENQVIQNENENLMIEERLTLTKEEEDIDVDVGVDEPMEVNTDNLEEKEVLASEEKIHVDVEEETANANEIVEEVKEAEDIIISEKQEEKEISSETLEKEGDNDNVGLEKEVIESQAESISSSFVAYADDNGAVIKENVEKEEEKFVQDSTEVSPNVIKRQKLETSNEEVLLPEPEVEKNERTEEVVVVEEMENETKFEEPSFFPENETSNLSQDDSECGELVIDLGPREELEDQDQEESRQIEDNNDDNVEKATQEEEELEEPSSSSSPPPSEQVSQLKESENVSSEACEEVEPEEKEEKHTEELSVGGEENASLSNHNSLTSSININMESCENVSSSLELLAELPSDAQVNESNNISEASSDFTNKLEGLNQNSISNQMPINLESIEVNGVIKSKENSSVEECEKKPAAPVVVVEEEQMPQQQEEQKIEEISTEEKQIQDAAVDEDDHSDDIVINAPCAENQIISNEENFTQMDEDISASNESPCIPSSLVTESSTTEDNKNTLDNESLLQVEIEEKIEEEQVVQKEQEGSSTTTPSADESPAATCETSETNEMMLVLVESESIGEEATETTPVHIPEEGDNIVDKEPVLLSDDTCTENPVESEKNDEKAPIVEEILDEEEKMQISEEEPTTSEVIPEIEDEPMEIGSDSVLPTGDSSECCFPSPSITNDTENSTTPTLVEQDDSPTVDNDGTNEEAMISSEKIDTAVISATITTTASVSEAVVVASSDIISSVVESSCSQVPCSATPTTTSTSPLAIKLDIAANDDNLDCSTNAESLVPAGNESSPIQSPCSNKVVLPTSPASPSSSSLSSPSSSASSSSHVTSSSNNSGGSGGHKSLETFGKVAAGFLASATSTINNNNNNNTSLAPTSCDAISIATTNANA